MASIGRSRGSSAPGTSHPPAREAQTGLGPGAVGLLLLGALVVGVALAFVRQVLTVPLDRSDLWVFREAGRLVRDGLPLYDHRFVPGYWTYPPFGGLVMMPLSLVPVDRLVPLAWAVDLVALVALVRLSFASVLARLTSRPARWTALAMLTVGSLLLFPVAFTVALGQLGILITLACTVDVVLLGRRRSRWQGVLVGLTAAVKLTPALFVPVFALGRRWSAAVVAALTVAVCWAAAALVRPGDTRTWIERRILLRTNDQVGGHGDSRGNQSLRGLVDGLPSDLVAPAWLLLAVPVLVLGLYWAARALRTGQLLECAAITGLTSVLVSPISWHHHGVWVLPALGALAAHARSRRDAVVLASLAAVLALGALAPQVDLYVLCYAVLLVMLVRQVRGAAAPGAVPAPPSRA